MLLAKILEEAGLPAGLISVLVGSNSDIGDGFVLHPIPRVIAFTGSASVGRRIGALVASGPTLKRAHLDLGGDNPLVVLEDADLQVAVDAAIVGRFLHQGELGLSANRIIVHASVHDEFVDRFAARALNLRCGDPNDITTIIGPVINQRLWRYLVVNVSRQHQPFCFAAGTTPRALFYRSPGAPFKAIKMASVATSQLLGPIALVIKVADESEALRVANDTDYGLSGAVFTSDLARGERFAQALEAGMTHVNDLPAVDLSNMPYGGRKNSGIDRFGPEGAIHVYTTEHWISVQSIPRHYPF